MKFLGSAGFGLASDIGLGLGFPRLCKDFGTGGETKVEDVTLTPESKSASLRLLNSFSKFKGKSVYRWLEFNTGTQHAPFVLRVC